MAPARYLVPYILITAFQYVFAKDALNYASPPVYGAITTLLMSVALFSASGGFKPVLNQDTVLFSLFYWLSGTGWLFGLHYISSAQSAVISFTMPLFAIPLAVWVLGERGTRLEALGAVVGFSGIVLFNLPLLSGAATALGVALTLVDAFFWALFTVFMKKLRNQDTARTLGTAGFLSFLLWTAASALDFGVTPSVDLAGDALFLGVIGGGLNFYLYMALIRAEKVGKLTTIIFLAPVVTLAYSVATTGVIPNYETLGGVVLIFLGIYASNLLGPRGIREAPPAPQQFLEHAS